MTILKRIKNKGRTEGLIIGAVLGAAAATVASLLFAPKSGKDLRKDISEGTSKTLEHADDYLDTAKKKGSKLVDDVEKSASEYLNLAGDKTDNAFSKAKGLFKRKANEAEDMMEDTTDALKDKYNDKGQNYNTYQYKR